jgi:uncharacterized membrane protein YqjE
MSGVVGSDHDTTPIAGGDVDTHEASIGELVRTALEDAGDLLRGEVALARVEMRQEAARLRTGGLLLAGAACAGVLALVFLLTAIAWALTAAFDWPVCAGFLIVPRAVGGATTVTLGVAGLASIPRDHLPSVDTYGRRTGNGCGRG